MNQKHKQMIEVLEAVFQGLPIDPDDYRETVTISSLEQLGLIEQVGTSLNWRTTAAGADLREKYCGPMAGVDFEDHEDMEKKLKKASTDCKRLAATLELVVFMISEDQKHLLITGRGPSLSLGDVVDGTLALHQRGEGDWW